MIDPVLIAISSSLAGKATSSLYDLVRTKFANSRRQVEVLEAADGAAPASPPVLELAEILQQTEQADTEFGQRLRAEWAIVIARAGDTTNDISGTISGHAVQARDIQGGIAF